MWIHENCQCIRCCFSRYPDFPFTVPSSMCSFNSLSHFRESANWRHWNVFDVDGRTSVQAMEHAKWRHANGPNWIRRQNVGFQLFIESSVWYHSSSAGCAYSRTYSLGKNPTWKYRIGEDTVLKWMLRAISQLMNYWRYIHDPLFCLSTSLCCRLLYQWLAPDILCATAIDSILSGWNRTMR